MVKKFNILSKSGFCAFLFVVMMSMQINAAIVYFDPSAAQVNTGEEIYINLVAADLSEIQNETEVIPTVLSGASIFNLTVDFDPAILDFTGFSASEPDLSFGDLTISKIGSGSVNFEFVSLDFSLNAQTTPVVTLGTITFKGLRSGDSKLSFSDGFLCDVSALPYNDLDLTSSASIHVPEPSTIMLSLSGLLSLLGLGVRRKWN